MIKQSILVIIVALVILTQTTGAGAVQQGAASSTCAGVAVAPGMDLQALIDAQPPGATFCFRSGIYRLRTPLIPRPSQRFIGAEGATLSGARVLGPFSNDDGLWVAQGAASSAGPLPGRCRDGGSLCLVPNDVFEDGRRLTRVASQASVEAGTYFQAQSGEVYLSADPGSSLVEQADAPQAIVGEPRMNSVPANVTVDGFAIEKFANPAQQGGAVGPEQAPGWVIEFNDIRLNHSVGVQTGNGTYLYGNHIHDNGQEGVAGSGAGAVIADNEIDHNNVVGYDPRWEAGGGKWVESVDLVIRGNNVHDNAGPGLWTDGYNVGAVIEDNTVSDNELEGIFDEISYGSVIRSNELIRNGGAGLLGLTPYRSAILVSSSPGTQVIGNTLRDNANGIWLNQEQRGAGPRGPLELANDVVTGNVIHGSQGASGLYQSVHDDSYYTGRNNRFENNVYDDVATARFYWLDRTVDWQQWNAFGNDRSGTDAAVPPGEPASPTPPPATTTNGSTGRPPSQPTTVGAAPPVVTPSTPNSTPNADSRPTDSAAGTAGKPKNRPRTPLAHPVVPTAGSALVVQRPRIAGTASVGATVHGRQGEWRSREKLTFRYMWQLWVRVHWASVGTRPTARVAPRWAGHRLRFVVIATAQGRAVRAASAVIIVRRGKGARHS